MGPEEKRLVAFAESPEVRAYLAMPQTVVYFVRRDPGHDGEIVWASASIREVLGFEAQDVVGRNAWAVFVAPEDLAKAAEYSARMSEGDLTGWASLRTADGTKRWVRFDALNRAGGVVVAFRPEPNPSEHHFHGFGRPTPDTGPRKA